MDMPHSRMPFLFYLYFCKFTKIFRVGKSLGCILFTIKSFLLQQHSFSTVSHTHFRCATHLFQMCHTLISDVLHIHFRCTPHSFTLCHPFISVPPNFPLLCTEQEDFHTHNRSFTHAYRNKGVLQAHIICL